jgi:hypothetical protein
VKATDQEINAAIELLRANGYAVIAHRSHPVAETPRDLEERLGIKPNRRIKCFARGDCPAFEVLSRGPSGRIIRLRSNQHLDAFLTSAF